MKSQTQPKGTEEEIELIIGNSNSNFSGVTSTTITLGLYVPKELIISGSKPSNHL